MFMPPINFLKKLNLPLMKKSCKSSFIILKIYEGTAPSNGVIWEKFSEKH
jgi:hypothetical protein